MRPRRQSSCRTTSMVVRRILALVTRVVVLAFGAAVWWSGQGRSLKAGEYRFDRAVTPLDVIDVLVRGDVYTQRITFPEGLTIEEMAKLYETNGFGLARDFVEAARSAERI